jgi:hypothetical protein
MLDRLEIVLIILLPRQRQIYTVPACLYTLGMSVFYSDRLARNGHPQEMMIYSFARPSCFCIVSATMRRWILPVAVLGMTSVKYTYYTPSVISFSFVPHDRARKERDKVSPSSAP